MADFTLADESGASPEAIANISFGPTHPDLPSTVPAGEPFQITVRVTNNGQIISPTDPDVCYDLGGGSGYATEMKVSVDGSEVTTDNDCFPLEETWTWTLDIPALAPGSHMLEVQAVGKNSGRVANTLQTSVTAESDSGGGGGDGGDDGTDDDDQNGNGKTFWQSLTQQERALLAGGATLAAFTYLRG